MRFFHPVTWCLIATSWLVLVLLWQVHSERKKAAALQESVRIYIRAADRYAAEAQKSSGQLSQCMAQF